MLLGLIEPLVYFYNDIVWCDGRLTWMEGVLLLDPCRPLPFAGPQPRERGGVKSRRKFPAPGEFLDPKREVWLDPWPNCEDVCSPDLFDSWLQKALRWMAAWRKLKNLSVASLKKNHPHFSFQDKKHCINKDLVHVDSSRKASLLFGWNYLELNVYLTIPAYLHWVEPAF